MQLSSDDAACIYARACHAWYGRKALRVVTRKLRELEQRGDASGVAAWGKVALALSQTTDHKRHQRRDLAGKLY